MGDIIGPLEQHTIPLRRWNIELTVVIYNGQTWFVMGEICAVMGVANAQRQRQQLQERELMDGLLLQLPVKTRGGIQDTWCIHRRGVSFWMILVNPLRARSSVRPNLNMIQRDILDAIDGVVWGVVDANPADPTEQRVAEIDARTTDIMRLTHHLENRIGRIEDYIQMPEKDDEENAQDKEDGEEGEDDKK